MSSFHGDRITTTVEELKSVCYTYLDSNDGEDKTNFDFKFKLPNGKEFWVYDWKEYRVISPNEYIDFHIGADTPEESAAAHELVIKLLNKKKND
jgi:hypothetical protein